MTAAVLFDLDGTLADTAPDLGYALNALRTRHGLASLPDSIIRPQASNGTPGLLGLGFGIEPGHPEFAALREEYLEIYSANICERTRLFDGMADLLDAIETRGLPWGVVTNKPARFTLPLVEALGLSGRAGAVVSGDSCRHSKPHPEPLFFAAAALAVPASSCLYLGDDQRDTEAALAAKMTSIVARWGYCGDKDIAGAHGEVAHPAELLAYL